ncbi:MAG: hypothetical protein ACRD0Y_00980 [Terriglobales bacterium]
MVEQEANRGARIRGRVVPPMEYGIRQYLLPAQVFVALNPALVESGRLAFSEVDYISHASLWMWLAALPLDEPTRHCRAKA